MQRRRRRGRRRCARRVRDYCRQFAAFMFSNVGIIGLVVAYAVAGAFIFQAIEGSGEIERMQKMARRRTRTAETLWQSAALPFNIFDEMLWKNNVSAELERYQWTVVKAIKTGWDGSDRTEYFRQWSFPGAFLYSLTVITTIGYGNISPRTDWGKVITIFYAMIGLPLFLLYLANIGNLLARSFKWFYVNVCLCRGCPGVAKRRATRMRMQIQAQLGEPLDTSGNPAREAAERRRSAPEWRSRNRCSDYLETLPRGGPLDHRRFQNLQHRGVSEPCTSRQYDLVEHSQARREIYDGRYNKDRLGREHFQNLQIMDKRNYQYRQNFGQMNRMNQTGRHEIHPLNTGYRHIYDTYRPDRRYTQNREVFDDRCWQERDEMERIDKRNRETERFNERRGPKRTKINEWIPMEYQQERNRMNNRCNMQVYQFDSGPYSRENRYVIDKTYRSPDENEFWQRSKNLGYIEDNWRTRNETYDPMDNYGEFEITDEVDETADSDEFTYITIDSQNVTVPITICVIIMVIYIIFGALLFGMWEDWDRVDGSYFCFISLTSIGFGDIVPGERIYARASGNDSTKHIDASFIVCSVYLLFGMALIAMCFNLMQCTVPVALLTPKGIIA